MAKEYIEKEAAGQAVLELPSKVDEDGYIWILRRDAFRTVDDFHAVDAMRITRCGACKHSKKLYGSELFFCEKNAGMFGEDEFCSRGEAEGDPA